MENTSGQGASAAVPAEIDRWNWGAFLLNWIWGIGNNTLMALLMFVPLVNMVMVIVLGVKGSAWAWRNKKWDSVEQFQRVQRSWAKWGVIVWLAFIALGIALFFGATAAMKDSEAYKLAVLRLETDERALAVIGKPLSSGLPMGEIHLSGPNGHASLSFSVEGPNGKGMAHVEAAALLGEWELLRLVLVPDSSGHRINLMPPSSGQMPERDDGSLSS
ncbi:MAG TPA: cytochrome c oxidase assembly factor Coa1 family protein [Ideonella sp.]|uniref:cytochrome c oxidase assembly factor Coa1 family protein n=1 Tax=Ideonella sp. TaxID=1929293 RepID=UPI002E372B2E|nr:cytochrome c oxidase assembly factor Coa1 family protein [Ideonella sp.]HEX5686268.1 cytochrome c oxidase assembly factor Coa1 family protein [Ideonella sp.]